MKKKEKKTLKWIFNEFFFRWSIAFKWTIHALHIGKVNNENGSNRHKKNVTTCITI